MVPDFFGNRFNICLVRTFDLTTINVTQKLDIRLLERVDLGFPAIKDQQFQSDPLIAESI